MRNSPAITLPPAALRAIDVLEEGGYEAWCVGGCVRDALGGRGVHDIDIASSAPWREAQRLFQESGFSVHETGVDFGTITVIVDRLPIEVTRFRADGDYHDARHPSSVAFVGTIEEDLARRDFTVNAMAYHPQRGLRDPFGGEVDLAAGRLKAVGDASERFREDALRILRGLRFASQLGLSLEEQTVLAMTDEAGLLKYVAVERVRAELERLLLGDGVLAVLSSYWRILAEVLPELSAMAGCGQNTPYHIYDVLVHTAHVVAASPATPLSRWAALFHDVGKPSCKTTDASGHDHFKGHAAAGGDIAQEALRRLKAPKHLVDEVSLLVRHHEDYALDTDANVLHALRRMGGDVELYRALLALQVADSFGKAPGVTERRDAALASQRRLESLLARGAAFSLQQLVIDGDDLIAQGWRPGPELGSMLDKLLWLVIEGVLPNSRPDLLQYASSHRSE